MDVQTARTNNIRQLVEEAGGPTAFADATARWTQAQVSQWISVSKPKGIGHRLARDIETEMRLPFGWMDHDHTQSGSNRTISDTAGDDARSLLPLATPRTHKALQDIITAAETGKLDEADLQLLNTIAKRLRTRK